MTEKEKRDTRPYVILSTTLTTHLEDVVAKYMNWGYFCHGDMIIQNDTTTRYIQVMIRRDI